MDLEILDFPEFKPKNIIKTYVKTPKPAPKESADRITRKVELKPVEKIEIPIKRVEELTTKNAVDFLLAGTLTSKVCKYCLNVTEVLFELDRVMEIANKNGLYSVTIKDMIASFHPFQISDDPNLPNKICEKCLDRTINSYLFTQQCEQTQRALINCLEDVNTKFWKLDPLEYVHRRGRRKINPNHNKIEVEHAKVIDYADPVIHIVNTSSEALSTEPVLNPLECLKCCQILPSVESLVSHSKVHPKTMWFSCRLCAKSFPKLYLLKRHYRHHQRTEPPTKTENKLFECKQCNATNKNYREHLQHLEKHRFKMVLEHVLYRKMDDLCAVCLDKGSLVPLNKVVSIHGGPPDLMEDRTMQSILDSTLPELHVIHKFTGSNICENCENNAITSYTFTKNAYFARDRLSTCVSRMLDNLEAIDPENNLIIEIASDTIMPIEPIDGTIEHDDKEDEIDDGDDKNPVFLEDEYRIKSEDEIEPEKDLKSKSRVEMQNTARNEKREINDEVLLNGYQLDVREFLTFKKKPKIQKVKKIFTCPTCDKHFLSDYFVKKHFLKHISKKLTCQLCSTEFSNKFSLNEHKKYAHVLFKSDYKACKICGRGFAKADKLKHHEKQHRNKTCMICDKVFKTQKFHDLHFKRHIPKLMVLKKKYGQSCSFCEKECSNDNQLSLHVNKVHLQIKPYACDMCEKKFYTQYNLRFHKKIHNKFSKEKCNFCNKIVNSRKLLVIHIRKHIGATPYSCQLCNQAFYSQSKLKKHMNSTHGGNFLCKICKNVSVSKNELKAHVNKAHSFL